MKIVVIIPSLNEEDNISNITKVVDRGLSKYYSDSDSLIVSVDSNSKDNTVQKFLNTSTNNPKKSIVNKEHTNNKGSNIRKGLSLYKNHADYFLMLDADVTSVREDWIKTFLDPLINKKAQMVAPIYTRNRYGGNITNHFSFPILQVCLNKDILQPIAGDFSFSRKLAADIYANILYPSDYQYGIDTVITWTAILRNYTIEQIKFGRKVHRLGFPTIVPKFQQVASTTFRLINENRNKILRSIKGRGSDKNNTKRHKTIDDKIIQAPSVKTVQKIKNIATGRIKKYPPPDLINRELYQDFSLDSIAL